MKGQLRSLAAHLKPEGGGLGIFTDRDEKSIWGWEGEGFEFRKSVFLVLLTTAVFFGLLDKCCSLKCFVFLTVFLGAVLCT